MGHLNLSLTALVPLAAYLVVRQLEGSMPARVLVPLLGLVGVTAGLVVAWRWNEPGEQRGLRDVELVHRLAEVGL